MFFFVFLYVADFVVTALLFFFVFLDMADFDFLKVQDNRYQNLLETVM